MSTEPISFTGKLSQPDFVDIHSICFRVMIRFSIRCVLAVLSAAIAAFIIVNGIQRHFVLTSYILLVVCAYFPFGWWILGRMAVNRRYWRVRDKLVDNTVTFTNESVFLNSTATDVRLNWDQLEFVVLTPRSLLFFVQPRQVWFWLPQRLFEGNTYKDSIITLLNEHKIQIRRMA